MANIIGPAPNPGSVPGTSLPSDETLLELAICNAIKAIFNSIPNLSDYVNVEARERFPMTDAEDATISTKPDWIVPTIARTSLIQIGLPAVEEFEYTADKCTQLNFTYPITIDLEVVDNWDKDDLIYKNSRDLYMAIYMVSRRAFKNNRTLGFNNVSHNYLQQPNVGTLDEEESGRIHAGDWSLEVRCTGVLV